MRLPKGFRLHPEVLVRRDSPNRSDRTGSISMIVLHSTESHQGHGTSDLEAIGALFANPATQASAHVCTDADGHSGRYVSDNAKAWHCVSYNSAALGVEQIGFAAQGKKAWRQNYRELHETARWVARWSLHHHIPIRRAHVSNGTVLRSGVTTHAALGAAGGGHWDPGEYPFRRVLMLARAIKLALRLRRRST